MAEEVSDPALKVPKAISLCVPVGGTAGLFFVIPICVTLPPLDDIAGAPVSQALPYIFNVVMGSPGGALGLVFLVLGVVMFCMCKFHPENFVALKESYFTSSIL